MSRFKWWTLLSLLTLVVIAGVVVSTEKRIIGDGGFLPCELRLSVVDVDHNPVADAQVQVIHADGTSALNYPFIEGTESGGLRTDKYGSIVLHQVRTGLQFGFQRHSIAGIVITETGGVPQYEIRIISKSYKLATIDADELLCNAWSSETVRFTVGDDAERREVELNVVRKTIVLARP